MFVESVKGTAPLRVLLLLGFLNGGGAERVALNLLNTETDGLDVRMGLLRRAGSYLPQANPAKLHFRDWGERQFPADGSNASFYNPLRFVTSAAVGPMVYRSLIREMRPDVVMSFSKGPNLLTWLALQGMGAERPVWIAREGNDIARAFADEAPGSFGRDVGEWLVRKAYTRADSVLVNSHPLADSLHQTYGVKRRRLSTIHNPVDIDGVRIRARGTAAGIPDAPFLLSVGRLERQKGHDLLLHAFATSVHRDTHRLVLLGEGVEEAALRRLAAELELGDRVIFAGFAGNPWPWIARADLFALPSRWEGFPNALAEALAIGAPALAADTRSGGPRALIDHGANGWLVPPEDPQALAAGIDTLLGNPDLRTRLGAEARESVEALRFERIMPQYGELIREQVALARRHRSLVFGTPAMGLTPRTWP